MLGSRGVNGLTGRVSACCPVTVGVVMLGIWRSIVCDMLGHRTAEAALSGGMLGPVLAGLLCVCLWNAVPCIDDECSSLRLLLRDDSEV